MRSKYYKHTFPSFSLPPVAILCIFPSWDRITGEPYLEGTRIKFVEQRIQSIRCVFQHTPWCCHTFGQGKTNFVMHEIRMVVRLINMNFRQPRPPGRRWGCGKILLQMTLNCQQTLHAFIFSLWGTWPRERTICYLGCFMHQHVPTCPHKKGTAINVTKIHRGDKLKDPKALPLDFLPLLSQCFDHLLHLLWAKSCSAFEWRTKCKPAGESTLCPRAPSPTWRANCRRACPGPGTNALQGNPFYLTTTDLNARSPFLTTPSKIKNQDRLNDLTPELVLKPMSAVAQRVSGVYMSHQLEKSRKAVTIKMVRETKSLLSFLSLRLALRLSLWIGPRFWAFWRALVEKLLRIPGARKHWKIPKMH